MSDKRIEIGAIATAHGIKGQFKVKAFCDDPMALTSYGPVFCEDGSVLSLKAHSHTKGFVLCSASEVGDRTMAEALRGTLLYVARDAMPEIEADEFYHADLIGYEVTARGAELVGTVIGIYDFGAGTVIELKPASIDGQRKKPIMVPFGDQYQPDIMHEAKSLIMEIAPEWLDDSKPDDGEAKD